MEIVGSTKKTRKNEDGTYTMTDVKLTFEDGEEIVVDSIILYPEGSQTSMNEGDKIDADSMRRLYNCFQSSKESAKNAE